MEAATVGPFRTHYKAPNVNVNVKYFTIQDIYIFENYMPKAPSYLLAEAKIVLVLVIVIGSKRCHKMFDHERLHGY